MSYSYGYNPKASNPGMSNDIPQMRSDAKQKPFYFGGSQVPVNLILANSTYSGSSNSGIHREANISDLRKRGKMIFAKK